MRHIHFGRLAFINLIFIRPTARLHACECVLWLKPAYCASKVVYARLYYRPSELPLENLRHLQVPQSICHEYSSKGKYTNYNEFKIDHTIKYI